MSQHGKDHKDHKDHEHAHHTDWHREHDDKKWRWHADWRTWVGVLLMLAAMMAYWLSVDERFRPGGGPPQPEAPAAP
jgi:hypothetical protein